MATAEFLWAARIVRASDGEEIRVHACLDTQSPANLINELVVTHLNADHCKLEAPIDFKCSINGVKTVLKITEYVKFVLSSPSFEYSSKEVVALIVPDATAINEQLVLGAPFLKDNKIDLDGTTGRAVSQSCGAVLIEGGKHQPANGPSEPRKLPKLTRERVVKRSVFAVVRERIEILSAQQELIDRGVKVKAEFPRLFDELPHGDDLPKDVYCRITLKAAEQTIKTL